MKPTLLSCLGTYGSLALLVCLVSSPALAQDDTSDDVGGGDGDVAMEAPAPEPEPEPAPEPEPEARPEPAASPGTTGPTHLVVNVHDGDDDEEEEEEAEPSPFDPHERQGDELYHFGVFARGIFAPQFIQNLFVEGGLNRLNPGVGAFFNYRRDGFNILAEVWWAGFYGQAPFHGLNETVFETEWLESELSVLFVSFAFMWSLPITSWLAFEIGFGLGFGGVFGDLWRTEAYPDTGSSAGWSPCAAPGDPDTEYCDPEAPTGEGSYQRRNRSSEPYNFSGGVPPLWFWVDLPRVAIRFKPIRQIQLRVDGGFALYAFHFGGSLAIGF